MSNIIVLIILGAVFYYILKSYNRYTAKYTQEAFKNFSLSYDSLKKSDLGLFVALVAKVAKADGRVDALEAQLVGAMFDDISKIFPQPQETKELLKRIFNEEKEDLTNTRDIAQRLATALKRNPAQQEQFMGFLIQLAFADGEVTQSEEDILADIAEAFAFDPAKYHAIFDRFEQMMQNVQPKATLEEAYKTLGVNKDDDLNTIKKAYRKLVRQYHPDIIKSQNRGEEYLKEATQKTQEINQAYEMIKKAKS